MLRRKPVSRFSGFGLSAPSLKTIAVICGVLVIGIIGPNWDTISSLYSSQNISAGPFINSGTPSPMLASVNFFSHGDASGLAFDIWGQSNPNPPNETGLNIAVPADERPLNFTKLFEAAEYTVRRGDNLSAIASRFSVSMESIIALNGLKDATILQTGRKLKIPNMNGIPYTVRANDNISRIAEREKIPVNAILDANDLRSDEIFPGQVLFLPGGRMNPVEYQAAIRRRPPERPMINPLPGRMHITSPFGMRLDPLNPRSGIRRFHEGIDLRGSIGTPVRATMDGVVEEISHSRVYGNFIILKHQNYRTLYAHLSAVSVRKGERVNQGREIGKVGNTGQTDGGSHLHFGVYDLNGNPINPVRLLR